jgi:membrane associated rhomboid family serine protease
MIPLRSSERIYSVPTVTLVLIAINVLIFLFEISLPQYSLNRFIRAYGITPYRFHFSTLLTSMFLHEGFLHILGNMWFLWIFGKAIEDRLGHGLFLLFYLVCGLLAGIGHVLLNSDSAVPTIGASGAIAGVRGAYLIKFPRARIVTLVLLIVFFTTLDIPAAFLLVYWFAMQFFNGIGSIAESQSSGGVAWFAHVVGFLAGMALITILPAKQRYSYRGYRDGY